MAKSSAPSNLAIIAIVLALASGLWSSGVIPSIIPQAVPPIYRQGSTGTKFAIATGNFTAGNCNTTDANGNLVDSGIGTCGGAGTSVNSWNGATGAVTYTTQSAGSNLTNRLKLNFTGALSAVDNAGTQATDVSVAGASSGAIASRPAAGTAGRIYIPTDSWYDLLFDTGSTWQYYRLGKLITPTTTGVFSAWVNQNGSTLTAQTNGALLLSVPVQPSGQSLSVRTATLPVGSFTRTFRFQCTLTQLNDNQCGVGFRESGTGKLVMLEVRSSAAAFVVRKWTSATSLSADYATAGDYRQVNSGMAHFCFRIGIAGSNTTFEYSADNGQNWEMLVNVAQNDFFTTGPDQLAFGAASSNATWTVGMVLISMD